MTPAVAVPASTEWQVLSAGVPAVRLYHQAVVWPDSVRVTLVSVRLPASRVVVDGLVPTVLTAHQPEPALLTPRTWTLYRWFAFRPVRVWLVVLPPLMATLTGVARPADRSMYLST